MGMSTVLDIQHNIASAGGRNVGFRVTTEYWLKNSTVVYLQYVLLLATGS